MFPSNHVSSVPRAGRKWRLGLIPAALLLAALSVGVFTIDTVVAEPTTEARIAAGSRHLAGVPGFVALTMANMTGLFRRHSGVVDSCCLVAVGLMLIGTASRLRRRQEFGQAQQAARLSRLLADRQWRPVSLATFTPEEAPARDGTGVL
jgi:hypothetical protein